MNHVGVAGVSTLLGRKAHKWKQLEIPATRFSCVSSGSCRPKLGLCILTIVVLLGFCLILIPLLIDSPQISAPSTGSQKQAMSLKNEAAVHSLAQANDAFKAKLYPLLVQAAGQDKNMVMSGFSASAVLAMAFMGATGQTASEMQSGLALPEDQEHLRAGFEELFEVLKSNENFTMEAANRLYVHKNYELLEDFLKATMAHFKAESENVDFGQEAQTRQTINDWVSERTHDKIKDLIPAGVLSDLTRLVLVNAVYFKGLWANKFDAKHTSEGDFQLLNGETVKVPMMKISEKYRAIMDKDLNATILEMPYKGDRLAMLLFLPRKAEGFQALEEKFPSIDLTKLNLSQPNKFDVALPKFKFESTHDLVAPLKALGIKDMFDESKADFSGISARKDLYVSAVMQKAFIEVNEEGTEAAAATSAIMMTRAMVMTPRFVCDRPFLFAIRDNLTGMTLFSGRVVDPSK